MTIIKNNRRRRRDAAKKIALAELAGMVPAFLVLNGIVLVTSGIAGIAGVAGVDWRIFTGLAVGNVAGALNFYVMALVAGRAVQSRIARRARVNTAVGYGARYIALFVIFGILITLRLINPVTAVLPLLYPSLHYKLTAVFNKSV
ncbi:MAG: hypothetical protein LBI38_02250 [Oscillospiraceae bacterium]|jgi:hypothetical protein|nr:hypothetical protein [Oscillospiraceae bacterium]